MPPLRKRRTGPYAGMPFLPRRPYATYKRTLAWRESTQNQKISQHYWLYCGCCTASFPLSAIAGWCDCIIHPLNLWYILTARHLARVCFFEITRQSGFVFSASTRTAAGFAYQMEDIFWTVKEIACYPMTPNVCEVWTLKHYSTGNKKDINEPKANRRPRKTHTKVPLPLKSGRVIVLFSNLHQDLQALGSMV